MRVLVIAPHPDDEVIGPGGALALHVRQGHRVTSAFITSGELGLKQLSREAAWNKREAEAEAAAKLIGVSQLHFLRQPDWMVMDHLRTAAATLRPHLRRERPDLIYLPHPHDWHPDHQTSLRLVRTALRGLRMPRPRLLGYEVWTPLGQHHEVRDITSVMTIKLRALRAHRSQLEEFDYVQAVRGLNAYRGALSGGCRYAEVFCDL